MAASTFSAPPYFGLFVQQVSPAGVPRLERGPDAPGSVPDPRTGQPIRVATIEGRARAMCPSCSATGEGGFVSFHGDLRLAYACPTCEQMVWLTGA
jgi:ribosomal protein S27AE